MEDKHLEAMASSEEPTSLPTEKATVGKLETVEMEPEKGQEEISDDQMKLTEYVGASSEPDVDFPSKENLIDSIEPLLLYTNTVAKILLCLWLQ